MSKQTNTRQLTACAMLVALGVVLLWIGSVLEVAEISMAVVASLLCIIAVIEYGGSWPWLVFAVTSVLSLVLLPNKGTAVTYALFFGYYPIIKEKLERHTRVRRWVEKELIFNAAMVALLAAWRYLLFPTANRMPLVMGLLVIVVFEAVFVLYDVALTRLISLYLFRLRKRFRWK